MLAQSAKEHEDIKVKLERANKQVSCLLKKEREYEWSMYSICSSKP